MHHRRDPRLIAMCKLVLQLVQLASQDSTIEEHRLGGEGLDIAVLKPPEGNHHCAQPHDQQGESQPESSLYSKRGRAGLDGLWHGHDNSKYWYC